MNMQNQYLVCLILSLQTADFVTAKAILRGQQSLDFAYGGDGPGITTKPLMTPGEATKVVQNQSQKVAPEPEWADFILQTPEGGIQREMLNPVKWTSESKFSKPAQYCFAVLWVLMLVAMPMVIPAIQEQPVSMTQKVVAAAMIVVVAGGFYLFTNIVLFQSGHFDEIRPLTIVECIYFMSQVITTVGYGDVGPAKIRGQIFVALYVLGALFVIAMVMTELVEYLTKKAHEYKHQLHKAMVQDYTTPRKPQSIHDILHKEKPSLRPLLLSLVVFLFVALIWVLFFSMHPGEGKSVWQAFYMSIITLSSVGLGYFTPVTEDGMVFGAFFMLFGTTALVNVIGRFTELTVEFNEWERCHSESKKQQVADLKAATKGTDKCTELEFVKFALLQMGSVDEQEIENISRAFQNMKPKNGEVVVQDIEDNIMSYGARSVKTPKSAK